MNLKRQSVHFDDEIVLWGDTYYYRGTPFGIKKRVERSLNIKKGAAQRDVLKAKKELIDSLEKVGSAGGKNSFSLIAEKYKDVRRLEAKDPKLLSKATLYETVSIMDNHLIPFYGTQRVEEIDQDSFENYCLIKRKSGLNLVNHRKVLNHFFKWCVHRNYLKYRTEVVIPKMAIKQRRKRSVLTEDEIKSLIKACDEKTLLYVSMYLFMGMRNMEICKLKWSDIDFEKKAIFINPENNRRRKSRAIPVNRYVYNLLQQRKQVAKSAWVFPSAIANGIKPYMDPSGGIRKAWARAIEKAEIKRHITPHDLRATFETFMHTNTGFTDTQREKMAGAQIDVQKDHYVSMQAEQLRGLEESVKIEGMDQIIAEKTGQISGGKRGGKMPKREAGKRATS